MAIICKGKRTAREIMKLPVKWKSDKGIGGGRGPLQRSRAVDRRLLYETDWEIPRALACRETDAADHRANYSGEKSPSTRPVLLRPQDSVLKRPYTGCMKAS